MMRRVLVLIGIFILAGLFAFPLRNAIYEVVVVPVAYLLWAIGLLYRALPQFIWWIVVAVLTLYMFGKSIVPNLKLPRRRVQKSTPPKGDVERLAEWMHKSEKGVYNKWLVANRLGKLAYQILLQRDNGRPRSLFAPLEGPDWEATVELKNYLHSGLQGSFADFPSKKGFFTPPAKTPLDHDMREAVEFLESKIDNSSR